MKGNLSASFFIWSRVGLSISIQIKPLFLISSTIRVRHIRHEFKVENCFMIAMKSYMTTWALALCNQYFVMTGQAPHLTCHPKITVAKFLNKKLHISMCFVLPTTKAIITIDLKDLGFSLFTWLTNDQGIGFAIDIITTSHRHTVISPLRTTPTLHIGEGVCATGLAWLAYTEKPPHTLLLWCEVFVDTNRSKFPFTVSHEKIWFLKSVYDYTKLSIT